MDKRAPESISCRDEAPGTRAEPSVERTDAAAHGKRMQDGSGAGAHPRFPGASSADRFVPLRGLVARFGVYTLAVISLVLAFPVFVRGENWAFFAEDGALENAQLLVLGAIVVLLIIAYRTAQRWEAVFALLAGVFLWCAIRENDRLFDELVAFGGWQLVAGVAWIVIAALVWRRRSTLLPGMQALASTPGPILLWAGFIVFAPLA